MRLSALFILGVLFVLPAAAQNKRIFLFENYIPGTALMKNRARIKADLNYDAANNNIMYKNGEDEMILTNLYEVDTVYIDTHKFIPLKGLFLEMVETPNGPVYVHWCLKDQYVGKRGAYGTVSQAKVETINTAEWQYGVYENQPVEVYKQVNQNEYYIFKNNKANLIKNEKALYKLYPEQAAEIREYIKQEKIVFTNTENALKLLSFCLAFNS